MPFGFFRISRSPVLADFGSSGLKLMQTSLGEAPVVTACASIPFSDDLRSQSLDARFEYIAKELPTVLREANFTGTRVVLAPFSQHMLVQHVGVPAQEAARADMVVRTQIAIALGCDPAALVVRTSAVCENNRDGQPKIETIAFAMSREDVMRYVDLFRRAKLKVVGVHGEISALVHAFDHVSRRIEDAAVSSMYIDLGYGGTKVAICHGAQLVFAKYLSIGGRTFDTRIAEARGVTLAAARALRLSEGIRPVRSASSERVMSSTAGLPTLRGVPLGSDDSSEIQRSTSDCVVATDRRNANNAPALGAPIAHEAARGIVTETRETMENLADELGMCTRYHGGLFRDRRIDRVIFLGGEARDVGLCQALASSLRLPAKAGDPMARYLANGPMPTGTTDSVTAHAGWAAACGLASAPTDL